MVLDIVSYESFGCVQTDGVDIVALRPELTTPQHLFDLWILFENLSCRDAFNRLNDVLGGCCGDGLYEQVHVIAVGTNFDEVDLISLLYSKTSFSERFDHTVGQYFPSIPYGTYDVVEKAGFVVALPYMAVFHATNIHRIALTSQQAARQSFLV